MNVHIVSLKGLRPQNEDTHFVKLNLNNSDPTVKNVDLYAIFDGHGGKTVSQYLQKKLPELLLSPKVPIPLDKNTVNNIYDFIQTDLKQQKSSYQCGSTCLIVIHYKKGNESYLNIINTGDCRCILSRDNFGMPLTLDHRPNMPGERIRIEDLGGEIKFDGMDWRIQDLSVSRAFGDCDATPFVTHRPDLYRYKLCQNDQFIVLGCDGLFEVLDNQTIVNFILMNCYDRTFKNRINKTVNIAEKLAKYAIEKGSTDNVSIIIVFLQ